jgi:hypothetical protein
MRFNQIKGVFIYNNLARVLRRQTNRQNFFHLVSQQSYQNIKLLNLFIQISVKYFVFCVY